jgi:hypothetical protein
VTTVLAVLAVGSTAPGLLAVGIDRFARVSPEAGSCTSHIQFDPQLESARLQPLSLPLDPS